MYTNSRDILALVKDNIRDTSETGVDGVHLGASLQCQTSDTVRMPSFQEDIFDLRYLFGLKKVEEEEEKEEEWAKLRPDPNWTPNQWYKSIKLLTIFSILY